MSELDEERLRRALLEIPYDEDAQYDYSAHGAEQLAQAVVARLTDSRPSVELAAARFVATHWRDAYLEQHRIDPSGQWAIGTHPLSLVLAALDGERDPVHLGLPAEVHGAFRAALAEADSEPVMSVAMSDADEGPA
jgi:hypothetical protein